MDRWHIIYYHIISPNGLPKTKKKRSIQCVIIEIIEKYIAKQKWAHKVKYQIIFTAIKNLKNIWVSDI